MGRYLYLAPPSPLPRKVPFLTVSIEQKLWTISHAPPPPRAQTHLPGGSASHLPTKTFA